MRTPIRSHMQSKGFQDPFHHARLCSAIDKAGIESQRIVFKCAPRGGVTTLLLETPAALPELSFGISAKNPHLAARHRRCQPRLECAVAHGSGLAGCRITGAFFVDAGEHAERVDFRWLRDVVATRPTPQASIFVIGVNFDDEQIADFKQLGYSISWA